MNYTQTITVQAPSATMIQMEPTFESSTVHLNLKLRLEARVVQLVNQIKESKLLSHESLELFMGQFLEQNPKNKNEHERISLLFCFLICDVLRPVMFSETKRANLLILEEFDRNLEALLKETVPPGESTEGFISTYESFSIEEEAERLQLQRITECFNAAITQAYASADEIDREIITTFDVLKTRIREINRKRQVLTQELQGTIDELSVRVERAIQIGKQVTEDQKKMAQRINDDGAKFEKTAQLFELILKKV